MLRRLLVVLPTWCLCYQSNRVESKGWQAPPPPGPMQQLQQLDEAAPSGRRSVADGPWLPVALWGVRIVRVVRRGAWHGVWFGFMMRPPPSHRCCLLRSSSVKPISVSRPTLLHGCRVRRHAATTPSKPEAVPHHDSNGTQSAMAAAAAAGRVALIDPPNASPSDGGRLGLCCIGMPGPLRAHAPAAARSTHAPQPAAPRLHAHPVVGVVKWKRVVGLLSNQSSGRGQDN